MTTFYRTFTYMVLFYALMAMSFVGQAKAQVVCTNLGAFTDCSGPGIDQVPSSFLIRSSVALAAGSIGQH